jgi:histidine triad (HIT) family protein
MNEEDYTTLLKNAKKIAPYLKKALSSKRVGMVVEGFGVPHTHIHLVPVNSGNELNPELAKGISAVELENIQILITDALKGWKY